MSRLRAAYRARLDWVPGAHRAHPLRTGIVALTVLGALLVIAFTQTVPLLGHKGKLVRARFADSGQLVTGRTPVRVHGVKVGVVDRVELARGARAATVVLRITDDALVVRRDAAARIRYRTVLGGSRFVDLDPGSPSAPALGDSAIPEGRTGSQVEWDDINQVFERDTRQAQRLTLRGLRATFAAPRAAGRTLDTLGPSLSVVGRWAQAWQGQESGDLRRLVRSTGETLRALSRDDGDLETLVAGAERTFATTAAHRRRLGEMVELAPAALESTTTTARRLVTTLDHLDPLVADLRPGARGLAPATRALKPGLDQGERLLRESRPLLAQARPLLHGLAGMARRGVPLIEGLRPTLRRLDEELLPFLRRRDAETRLRNYESIGPAFAAADAWGVGFDADGHFLNFSGSVAADSVVVPCGPDLNPPELKRCDAVNDLVAKLLGGRSR